MVIFLKIIPDLLLLTLKRPGERHSGGNSSFAETSTASNRHHKTGVYSNFLEKEDVTICFRLQSSGMYI